MASFALLSWPFLAVLLFRRLSALQGVIWVVLLPYLFLPERKEIELPGLPDIDKVMIITIGLILCVALCSRQLENEFGRIRPAPMSKWLKICLWLCALVLMTGLFLTVWYNREPLTFGPTTLPPARPWDALSSIAQWTLVLLPFLFATRYLSTPKAHRALLTALVLAGLAYSVFILIELRFSPQLHRWVYGYHQHSFAQHIRAGYRPMVFLQHGLWVGFFFFMTVISAAAMWKVTQDTKWRIRGIWLFIILVLSQNVGALIVCLLMLMAFFWFRPGLQRWFVLLVALFVLIFPALRQSQIVPTNQIIAAAAAVSEARAQSLEFRLRNEDQLLERAWEKKWTGWGGWGRDRVYNERGRDLAISEGRWIQTLGQRGWIGYLSLFGLLILPLIWFALSRRVKTLPVETVALALVATGNLIYMIPNSTMTPIGLMVFGAVAGFMVYGTDAQEDGSDASQASTARREARYTRFGPGSGKLGSGMRPTSRRGV